MFDDQKVELLPERTTMATWAVMSGNTATAAALNAANVNAGDDQANVATALAVAGSIVHLH